MPNIFSIRRKNIWHIETLYPIPVDGYDEVKLVEIDKYEYQQLKALNGRTPEEIFDDAILYLIDNGIL